jgi:hypothetical protein
MIHYGWQRKTWTVLAFIITAGLLVNWQVAFAENQEPVKCDIPPVDIPGEDLSDFPRFPGSVRTQYTKESERFSFTEKTKVKGIMVKFLSTEGIKQLMEFYSKSVEDKGWKIISSQYLSGDKANLTLEKEPNRVMLTLEPDMKPTPASKSRPSQGRSGMGRSNQPARPMFVRTKCYSVSIFLYEIPPPGTGDDAGMTGGFPF